MKTNFNYLVLNDLQLYKRMLVLIGGQVVESRGNYDVSNIVANS